METPRREKPRQSWAGLLNISFGFFGIQIGFALQNANMSRVFQSLGGCPGGFHGAGQFRQWSVSPRNPKQHGRLGQRVGRHQMRLPAF